MLDIATECEAELRRAELLCLTCNEPRIYSSSYKILEDLPIVWCSLLLYSYEITQSKDNHHSQPPHAYAVSYPLLFALSSCTGGCTI
jgi:hypothetical protein